MNTKGVSVTKVASLDIKPKFADAKNVLFSSVGEVVLAKERRFSFLIR